MLSTAKLAFRIAKFTYWTLQKHFRTLRAFALFPFLPIELRLIIWTLALPGPSIHELKQIASPAVQHITIPYWEINPYNPKSPALLFTNREAREVALRYYQPFQHGRGEGIRVSYLDPRNDIVLYRPRTPSIGLEGLARLIPKLEKLAVCTINIWEVCNSEKLKLLKDWKYLMVVDYLTHAHDGLWGNKKFKEMSEQDWNKNISFGGIRERNYASFLQIGSALRSLDERRAEDQKSEAWVAPKFRIGEFVP